MIHDPLCPLMVDDVRGPLHAYECPCDLIAKARVDERRVLVEQLRAEFPKPTLGIQKAIRMLEAS